MSDDWTEMVIEFHRKFAPQIPRPNPELRRMNDDYAIGFIEEEYLEVRDAMFRRDLEGVADGLADLIYVAIRAALIWGIDLRPVFAEVHRANMAKEGGHLRPDGKLIKPPGWRPPDIAGVLARQPPMFDAADFTGKEIVDVQG